MNLVLLPGLDGTGVLFRPLLAALPTTIKPIVVSYPTKRALEYAELQSLVMHALPTNQPFVLLGESFGGPLSLKVAAARPSGLRGVILCGSFVTCPINYTPRWLAPLVRSTPFYAFPLLAKMQRLFNLYETKEHYELGREAVTQVAAAVWAHRIREILRVDVTAHLTALDCPLLYMLGTNDRVVREHNLRRIQTLKNDVQVERINSGHMILKTRPIESAKIVTDFVRRVTDS